jgi:hypothetical protein
MVIECEGLDTNNLIIWEHKAVRWSTGKVDLGGSAGGVASNTILSHYCPYMQIQDCLVN